MLAKAVSIFVRGGDQGNLPRAITLLLGFEGRVGIQHVGQAGKNLLGRSNKTERN